MHDDIGMHVNMQNEHN